MLKYRKAVDQGQGSGHNLSSWWWQLYGSLSTGIYFSHNGTILATQPDFTLALRSERRNDSERARNFHLDA